MHYLRRKQGQSRYEWASRLGIVALLGVAVLVELAAPVLAWRWTRQPFLGAFVEHTLVVSDLRRPAWSAPVPGNPQIRLAAVDGRPVGSARDLAAVLAGRQAGERVALRLERRDGAAPLVVEATLRSFSFPDWLQFFWLPYGVGLVYLAIGVWVFWLRGDQRPAQAFAVFGALVAVLTGAFFNVNTGHELVRVWTAALPLAAAAIVHLGLIFPEEGPLVRRRPLARFGLYPLAALLAAVAEWRLFAPGEPWAYIPPWRWSYAAIGVAFLAFGGLMVYSRARTLSPIVRQQVRIILLGSLLAFLPVTVFFVLAGLGVPIPFQPALYLPALAVFPVSIAYAILRYRLLGLDLWVSRGLAYAVLLLTIVGAYLLALSVLGRTLGATFAETQTVVIAVLAVLLILVVDPLRRWLERLAARLLGWRRFDYRGALQIYSRELATAPLDLPALLRRLLAQVEPVSQAAPALVFLFDPHRAAYTPRQAGNSVLPPDGEASFGREGGLAAALAPNRRAGPPVYLPNDDGRLPAGPDRRTVEALGLVLFLPLHGQDRLAGWVALGPRPSGEPYTPDDVAFLAALADQTAIAVENAQLLDEARHQAEELRALHQTALDISGQPDLPELLRAIVERAARLLGASGGGVHLVEGDEQRLRLVTSFQLGADYTGLLLEPGEGLAGRVAAAAAPLRVDDYRQFPGRPAALADAPFRAVLGVPLLWQGRVLGVINVIDTADGRTFSADDERLLTQLAGQASIALRNAQLVADLERRVVQLDALRQIGEAVDLRQGLDTLFDQIYVQTERVLKVDNFYVALYDAQRRRFDMAYYVEEGEHRRPTPAWWPLGTGLTSDIVRQRKLLVTDDYLAECERRGIHPAGRPANAWLGAPLLAGDEVLGVLNVSSFEPGYRYSDEQVQLLQAIADQAALAIERMRLYHETSSRAAELVTLNQVSQTISSTLDLAEVLALIMNKVVEVLAVEAGSLLLVDDESSDLVFRVVLGEPAGRILPGRRLPLGRGIVGHVAQTGRAEIVNDVQADPRWSPDVDRETGMVTRSILCAPMIGHERVIGVIEAMNHRDGTPFRESEQALLVALAAQAAVAIDNARLYTMTDQALASRVEELSTMQRIDRELNAALDFDHVMEMTVDWALRITGAGAGVIGLVSPERDELLLLGSRGYASDLGRRPERWPLNRGIAGRVLACGEPALVGDVTQDPDYYPAQPDTRSQLTVPIRREQAVIGIVNVESARPGAFDDDDLAFLRRLADHAAVAIENARLYRESQRWAEEMALLYDISLSVSSYLGLNDVLEAVYARVRDVWQPPVFFIAVYEREADALDFLIYVDRGNRLAPFRHRLSEQSGLSAWIVRNRQPILIHDWLAENGSTPAAGIPVGDVTRSWLGVPLVAGDQMVGVMAVQDYAPGVYGEEHRRFLSTIASEVAIAIENARLYQETQQRLRELTVLFDTSAALSVTLDVSLVLDVIASQVTALLAADGCVISVWDRDQDTLVNMLNYAPNTEKWRPASEGTAYPLADYPASRRVLESRRPVLVREGDPDADPAELEWMRKQSVTCLLMVPMVVRDEAVGLLEPMLTREDRDFTATDIGLIQTMANQAAAALENARLYEGVKAANQAKSEFIDFVAHELKQPMTSIQGYARMMSMGIGGEMTPTQRQFVQVITSNVDRMGKLVNDLLEISRLEAGRIRLRLAPVDLGDVVEETVTNTRTEIEARQHTLEVDVDAGLPPVLGDRERLVQILTNLVSNAYKYTPNGGKIRIAVDGRSDPRTPPGQALVTVTDTGIGMTPQELAHLEEKFYRADHPLVREQPGTGLGVSITRRLVALHGGELMVESEVGKGSTFRFSVPLAPA